MPTVTARPSSWATNYWGSTMSNPARAWDGNTSTCAVVTQPHDGSMSQGSTNVFGYTVPTGAVVTKVSAKCAVKVSSTDEYAPSVLIGVQPGGSGNYYTKDSGFSTSNTTYTIWETTSASVIASKKTFRMSASVGENASTLFYDTFTLSLYELWIEVTYTMPAQTVTASAGDGGSITPSGNVSVTYGGSKTFSISPSDGYLIEDVLVDGISVGAVSSYTFTNVTTAHSISASFAVAFDKTAMFLRRRERWL